MIESDVKHHNSTNQPIFYTKKTTTYDVGKAVPCFGQAQKWDRVKPVK
jgi:hypothetical protein